MQDLSSYDILSQFLSIDVSDGAAVFNLFATLPGAVVKVGKKPLERYVYVPGTRKDAVVLVAHADTVWDQAYGRDARSGMIWEDGIFRSTGENCGIGADDRAGCAMLWALRNSGHSLLVVDGEEKGKIGAKFLRRHNKKLFRALNRHCFMMELDWQGTGGCLYNQVENTPQFKNHIAKQAGFRDDAQKGGCDLQVLCQRVCGVNIGVGYRNHHRNNELLNVAEWENTLRLLTDFLSREQVQFPIPLSGRCRSAWRKCRALAGKVLRKLGIKKQTAKRTC